MRAARGEERVFKMGFWLFCNVLSHIFVENTKIKMSIKSILLRGCLQIFVESKFFCIRYYCYVSTLIADFLQIYKFFSEIQMDDSLLQKSTYKCRTCYNRA